MELRAEEKVACHWPVIFALGFFAFVAQSLLFRAFLTVYEGNELGVGCFFSSWLLWVGAGALLARAVPPRWSAWVTDRFEWLPLAYLPAYGLQLLLIEQSRHLAGIASYELFPFGRMLPVSFLANAPVSFCTGLLFTLACRWLSRRRTLAVAWVYIWEALGSCAGGVAATVLLSAGASPEATFFAAALVVAGAIWVRGCVRRAYFTSAVPVLLLAGAIGLGLPGQWSRLTNLHAWNRLLPATAYAGSFTTPQTCYHFGRIQGQFIVAAWESIVESIPAAEHAAEVMALHLAQKPDARRVLVIGSGSYSICQRLSALPQIERITWLAPDPLYPRQLLQNLPAPFRSGGTRVEVPGADPRRFLEQSEVRYDLIILNLPDATTLILNRYFTREFFLLLQRRLNGDGLIGIRVSAGENYMGTELVNVGAAVYHTLRTVFAGIALKPGEETWLLAADSGNLSLYSLELRTRFRQVPGAERLYPADGLLSLYSPERIDYQLSRYRQAEAAAGADKFLLNTDRDPKALLHALLFVARQTTAPEKAAGFVRTAGAVGLPILAAAVILYVLLRAVYAGRAAPRSSESLTAAHQREPPAGATPRWDTGFGLLRTVFRRNPISSFDSHFLVFSTGAAGMGSNLLLMFLYQSRFGTIFLHLGLISAVFMLGLTMGSIVTEQLLVHRYSGAKGVLAAGIGAHLLFLTAVPGLTAAITPLPFFLGFFGCGLLCGVYVPVAAAELQARGAGDAQAGSLIELNDHAGGALGGLLTGLFLLPVLGLSAAVAVQALLIAANLTAFIPGQWRVMHLFRARGTGGNVAPPPDRFDRVSRATGYVLFGVAVFVLVAAWFHGRLTKVDIRQLLMQASRSMVTGGTLVETTAATPAGSTLHYLQHRTEAGGVRGYLFASDQLAADVRGYGGPITLAMVTDESGVLKDVNVLHSNETPAYLKQIGGWLHGLTGRNIFADDPFRGIDAVSGATVTSAAVMRTLGTAGKGFASQVLGLHGNAPPAGRRFPLPDRTVLLLTFLALAVVVARQTRLYRFRRTLLLASLLVAGVFLNAQYSLEHVASAVFLKLGDPGWSVGFVMAAGIPLLVILFGNVYCGYLCPFGALQELAESVWPRHRVAFPRKAVWRYARAVKYLVLFVGVCLLATAGRVDVACLDPLVTVFSRHHGLTVAMFVALLAVALSPVFPRFWCRSFCPAGAFLSLLGGLHLLRRCTPEVHPKACVYGVRDQNELDCLRCDRCRRLAAPEAPALQESEAAAGWQRIDKLFLAAVLGFALLFVALAVPVLRAALHNAGTTTVGSGAVMRTVDMPKLKTLLDADELSNHEAKYYRPADPPVPGPATRQPHPGTP